MKRSEMGFQPTVLTSDKTFNFERPPEPARPELCAAGEHEWRRTTPITMPKSNHVHCAREGCDADGYRLTKPKMSDCPSPLGSVCKDPTCSLHFGELYR